MNRNVATPIVRRVIHVLFGCAAAGLAVASTAQTNPTAAAPAQARMPLNPQPLPPRWSAQPGDVARPAPGIATGIIVVGGKPVAAAAPTVPVAPPPAPTKLDATSGRR